MGGEVVVRDNLCLDGEFAGREVPFLLLLLERLLRLFVLGELPADCAGLLWSEVKREVLLAFVELAQVLALLRVHNGQDAGNRLADTINTSEFR